MCEFSKDEFIDGMESLGQVSTNISYFSGAASHLLIQHSAKSSNPLENLLFGNRVDSIEKFSEKIPELRAELKDERTHSDRKHISCFHWTDHFLHLPLRLIVGFL